MTVANDKPVVCVFGANDATPGQEAYELARGVGRQLAQLGYVVVNGGYGGTMEASALGATESGGTATGVTCRLWSTKPNAYVERVVETPDLLERLRTLVELGRDGYVALPGATGTLVELATVWEMTCKGFLTRRPIVCMGAFWRPLVEMMARQKPALAEYIGLAQSPSELGRYFPKVGGGA